MKNFARKSLKSSNGITLIALVITIIILLILAGISISMLSGNNSILNQAASAKEKTDESNEKEGIELATLSANIGKDGYQEINQENLQNAIDAQFGIGKATVIDNGDGTFTVSFIHSKKDYNITSKGVENGVNWNTAMKEVKAPESQTTTQKNVIGIGTDGNAVNMDLWEYTLLEDNTYILNDSISPTNAGYLGTFTNNGEIIGKIPQYISIDGGKNYKSVSSLHSVFKFCSDLKIAPEIPRTITNLNVAFSHTAIEKTPYIPSNVTALRWTFEYTKIKEMPLLPESIEDVTGAFSVCQELKVIKKLPNNIVQMDNMFGGCIALEEIPNEFSFPKKVNSIAGVFKECTNLKKLPYNFIISNEITTINKTFADCPNLEGNILLDITPTIYVNFLQKTSTTTNNKLVVNYTSKCSNIDTILSASSGTNAIKGSLITN